MIAALLLGLARADELVCGEFAIVSTVPRNHAEEVPLDVRPAVVFEGGPCPSEASFLLTLNVAGEGEWVPIASATVSPTSDSPIGTLTPDAPLEPLTRYRLDVEDEALILQTAASFTTGEALVDDALPAPAAPALISAWSYRTDGGFRIQAGGTVAVQEDPSQLSLVRFALADSPATTVDIAPLFGDEPVSFVANALLQERADPLCLIAARIDGAGREGEASEPGCAELGRGDREGCAHAPGAGAPFAGGLAFALLLGRRRR